MQLLGLSQRNKSSGNYVIAPMFTANSPALETSIKLFLSSQLFRKNKYFPILLKDHFVLKEFVGLGFRAALVDT